MAKVATNHNCIQQKLTITNPTNFCQTNLNDTVHNPSLMMSKTTKPTTTTNADLSIQHFTAPHQWEAWLAEHHANTPGLWLRFYKKASVTKSITYAEALDGALCYGWIDGQAKSYDADSWLQRFTPRRPKSL
ncbi:MAG TPA: hypothetical protein VJJ83_02965, partial [Candidatus Babeliales bacterium]|nr:hypothetical protein [Candidatus Babeliales bacterium]